MQNLDSQQKAKNISLIGTRGIPARYGGFEKFAAEISPRLVDAGYNVTVFSRHSFGTKRQTGKVGQVAVKSTFTIMHKYLETPVATISAFLSLIFKPCDLVLLCNAANSPFAWIPRILGIPVLINVDGIERERSKWNAIGKFWYLIGEHCSVLFASRIIADADVIQDYYQQRYQSDSTVIAYGASAEKLSAGPVLEKFSLEAKNYILYVSRLEPENNALGVIEAYVRAAVNMPLVIVGDAPYADEYKKKLKQAANEKVIFTGYQFDQGYQELMSNCYFYIQATEVGGTHPALVEAMAYGNCVVANGTPENKEVLADAGIFYEKNDFLELEKIIKNLLSNGPTVSELGQKAAKRAQERYNWETIANKYCELIDQFLGKRSDRELCSEL